MATMSTAVAASANRSPAGRRCTQASTAALQAEFQHAELKLLDGCGHVPMADCPEAFDREMTAFLAAPVTGQQR